MLLAKGVSFAYIPAEQKEGTATTAVVCTNASRIVARSEDDGRRAISSAEGRDSCRMCASRVFYRACPAMHVKH